MYEPYTTGPTTALLAIFNELNERINAENAEREKATSITLSETKNGNE